MPNKMNWQRVAQQLNPGLSENREWGLKGVSDVVTIEKENAPEIELRLQSKPFLF